MRATRWAWALPGVDWIRCGSTAGGEGEGDAECDPSGENPPLLRVVGGGALNALLCQRIADHAGLPVIAGPVEATVLGNVLIQAQAAGAVAADLTGIRELVARHTALRRFTPFAAK